VGSVIGGVPFVC